MDRFTWKPGHGFDESALERMRRNLPCPRAPMGEAWFMTEERRRFDDLLGDIDAIPVKDLQGPLGEIVSGTSAFGPMQEWNSWYHHLLAVLVPRSHERYLDYLLEDLVSGFICQHPHGVREEPYRGFADDALATLGRCMMDGTCWQGNDIVVGSLLHPSNENPSRVWGWWNASGDFSASVFFCLKYLPAAAIPEWLRSVLRIPSPHWRAQLIAWLVGAHDLLQGTITWPSQLEVGSSPSVGWAWSHCLKPGLASREGEEAPALLPEENRTATLRVLEEELTEDCFLEWLLSLATFPYLEAELAGIPTTFEQLYLRRLKA